ncbi:MAG: phytoene synthase [Acidocella sp. 20-57-95]|nr:MAG: phytoene synthase [Acidocella sp. 20-57-95]OYV61980.1 MAG: phytoene synthase [Acidocella sp. 21-58-7]HQT64462.1 squalene/phytoene synthase family protein [Acidocella sp.]HQU04131.1 squalene/phytoene synthase family protein [Acidocella sp.]
MTSSSELLIHIRRADPDRYFTTLFAPSYKREALWLLYAFNHELARAREVASEPTLALIRLTWWREVVDGAVRKHEIATPLTEALNQRVFRRSDLAALIDAREAEAEPQMPDLTSFMNYVRGTAGRLAWIAGRLLGAESEAVEDLGTAYGISGILRAAPFLARQGRSLLPVDGTPEADLITQARALLQSPPPRAAMAACLPAVYARRDLGQPFRPRGLGDKLAVLNAAMWGRI